MSKGGKERLFCLCYQSSLILVFFVLPVVAGELQEDIWGQRQQPTTQYSCTGRNSLLLICNVSVVSEVSAFRLKGALCNFLWDCKQTKRQSSRYKKKYFAGAFRCTLKPFVYMVFVKIRVKQAVFRGIIFSLQNK